MENETTTSTVLQISSTNAQHPKQNPVCVNPRRDADHAAFLEDCMNCPVCTDTSLMMSNREGVEIDYCPKCRGVWLDRGELDKIIERSQAEFTGRPDTRDDRSWRHRDDDDDDDDYRQRGESRQGYQNDPRGGYPQKKRRGFFGDLFEFGD